MEQEVKRSVARSAGCSGRSADEQLLFDVDLREANLLWMAPGTALEGRRRRPFLKSLVEFYLVLPFDLGLYEKRSRFCDNSLLPPFLESSSVEFASVLHRP